MSSTVRTSGLALAAGAILCIAGAASATTTTATYASAPGLEGLGSFSALVTYAYASGSTASLTIALSNTSNAGNGGFITGLALNGAAGVSAISFTSATNAAFSSLSGPISANPYGDFEAGSSTSSSWLGGGSPTVGIGTGNTATFQFVLTGSAGDLSVLDAAAVLSPSTELGMAVRFRGFNSGGSDKVIGYVIPGPGSLAVLALGAMVSRSGRRRR